MDRFYDIIRSGKSEFLSGADPNKVWDYVLTALKNNLRCSNHDIRNTFHIVYDPSLLVIGKKLDDHLLNTYGCSSRNCCKAALRFGVCTLITYTRKRYMSPRKNKNKIMNSERKIALLWIDERTFRMLSPVPEQIHLAECRSYIPVASIL